ncbi:sensor histidine kinase [Latilactobacillus fragifolii]|uniref:sensor histidine kinase n=1 Tax=Latilactobacillus fragifolii TaxID=2814244 RepID=UPI001ABAF0DF|nr:GHKL domain-containing protein [Latilactobacillus fragifolii]
MTMPLLMQVVINLSTFSSFLILILFLIGALKQENPKNIIIKVVFGIIFVQGMDLIVGDFLEELWLILAAIGIFGWMNGFDKLSHLKTNYELLIAIFLSYLIVMFSSVMTTLGLIGYTRLNGINKLAQLHFTWIMVGLIMLSQLMIAAGSGILVKRLYQIIKAYIVSNGIRVAGLILTGFTLFVGAVIVLFDEFKRANLPAQYLYLVLGIVLILMILIIIGMLLYTKAAIQQNKVNLEQENQRSLTLYIDQLERNYQEVRKFRHDIANALLALEVMINERGDSVLVQDYHALLTHYNFDTIQDQAIGRFQDINNAYIKGIIFSKYIEAHNKRISFNLEVQPALFKQHRQYFDELRILGIFLDNAIEAVAQVPEGQISVSLFEQNNKTVYSVKNTITEPVEFGKIYQSGYSTKGTNRGIGLATAKEITDARQDFHLILKQDGDYFVAMLVVEMEETHG